MTTVVAIGTVKGAWFASSEDRATWDLTGPFHRGWEVTTFGRSPSGAYLLATGSSWYGAAIHRSVDLSDWQHVVAGPSYAATSGRNLERIWEFAVAGDRLYAGVAEAGLFVSEDDGAAWAPVPGLNDHPTQPGWQPGLGGLALHRILVDPHDVSRLWVAISAVGVFASDDGGETWDLRNQGVQVTAPGDAADIGYCVHSVVADPADADRIWRQDHRGIYRTVDGGRQWERIQMGIPGTGFGFPIVRDHRSGDLYVIPLESDEYRMPVDGRLAVFRSVDGGDSWTAMSTGLRKEPSYAGVLRGAMSGDGEDPGGIYFGTTGGEVWWSVDGGAAWKRLPATFPRITSIKVLSG